MPTPDVQKSAEAEGSPRAAIVELNVGPGAQVTIVPVSASGTGTITGKPFNKVVPGVGFESIFDAAGSALTVDLSAQKTFVLNGYYGSIKVESDTGADEFFVTVSG